MKLNYNLMVKMLSKIGQAMFINGQLLQLEKIDRRGETATVLNPNFDFEENLVS